MKAMNENLGKLIALGLDLNLFWQCDFTGYSIQIRGYSGKRLENYILSKGFEKYDWLYDDRPDHHEYKNGNCRILLTPKK